MLKELITLSSEIIISNPYWQYGLDKYQLPGGNTADYHYVRSYGSVMIIPRLITGEFLLTKQFRYLNKKVSIEFPGGGNKTGLSIAENAASELAEETGYKAGKLTKIGEFNPFVGVTDEICSIYLGEELLHIGQNTDDTEEIEVIRLDYQQISSMVAGGEIWDGRTLASWSIFTNQYQTGK